MSVDVPLAAIVDANSGAALVLERDQLDDRYGGRRTLEHVPMTAWRSGAGPVPRPPSQRTAPLGAGTSRPWSKRPRGSSTAFTASSRSRSARPKAVAVRSRRSVPSVKFR